jgi:hypothetical protein
MVEKAKIKCPKCGHVQEIGIPDGKCLAFYKCKGCGKVIQAKEECCVICEYSDKKCQVSIKK